MSTTRTERLSPAQQRFLDNCRTAGFQGSRTPFIGGQRAGAVANGWYRTALVLAQRGLIILAREGDAQRAWLPEFAPDALQCFKVVK